MNVIIHQPHRNDRIQSLANLATAIGGASIFQAVEPSFGDALSKSVKGCSMSHLQIVESQTEDVLVLEDDALADAKGWEAWLSHAELPEDCGAILLGGDAKNYGEPVKDFHPITGEFFGTQAVHYLTAKLKSKDFTKAALAIMVMNPVGSPVQGVKGLCYESILLSALQTIGLKLYRPARMAFTTIPSYSEREGKMMNPRTEAFDITPQPTE